MSILNSRGMSIMEVVIAVGIGAIVMGAMTSMMVQNMRSQAKLESRMDEMMFRQEVNSFFQGGGNACSGFFGNFAFNTSGPFPSTQAMTTFSIAGQNYAPNANEAVNPVGSKSDGHRLRFLTMEAEVEHLASNFYQATLSGSFKSTISEHRTGVKQIGSVVVQLNGAGRVARCATTEEAACVGLGATWDPNTSNCQMPPPTPAEAQAICGSLGGRYTGGRCQVPPDSSQAASNCRAMGGSWNGTCRTPMQDRSCAYTRGRVYPEGYLMQRPGGELSTCINRRWIPLRAASAGSGETH